MTATDAPAGAGGAPGGARGTLGDGLRMAVGTLTAVRVPPPRRIDRRVAAVAMVCAPLAALVPGAAAAVLVWAGRGRGASDLLCAALAIGLVTLMTRGFHLDGLADTADGLAAAYDRERALAVMRRGDTGPAGATTLVLVLLVQVMALAQATARFGPAAVVVAVVAGRGVLSVACARGIPSARPEGLGATVSGSVPRTAAAVVTLLVAAGAAVVTGVPAVAAAPPVGVAAAGVLLLRARRRLGGVTGDVLGACVETATTATLVALVLLP